MKNTESGPHICGICMKAFDRRDLRDRHKRRCAVKKPRVSKQRSCVSCARSKLRCNLGFPACERCIDRGTHCEYPSHQSEFDQQSSESQLYEPSGHSYRLEDPNYSTALSTPYEEEMLGLSPSGSYSAASCSADEQMEPWNPAIDNSTTFAYPSTNSLSRFSTGFSGDPTIGGSGSISGQRTNRSHLGSNGSEFMSSGLHFSNNPQTYGTSFTNYEQNANQQFGNPAYLSMSQGNTGMDYRSEGPRLSHSNMATGSSERNYMGGHYYSTTAAGYGTQEHTLSSSHYPVNHNHTMSGQSTITTTSLPIYRNVVSANASTQPSGNLMAAVASPGYYSGSSSHSRAYSQPESHMKRSLPENHRRYR